MGRGGSFSFLRINMLYIFHVNVFPLHAAAKFGPALSLSYLFSRRRTARRRTFSITSRNAAGLILNVKRAIGSFSSMANPFHSLVSATIDGSLHHLSTPDESWSRRHYPAGQPRYLHIPPSTPPNRAFLSTPDYGPVM